MQNRAVVMKYTILIIACYNALPVILLCFRGKSIFNPLTKTAVLNSFFHLMQVFFDEFLQRAVVTSEFKLMKIIPSYHFWHFNELHYYRETATGKFMLRQGNGHYLPIYLWFRQNYKIRLIIGTFHQICTLCTI